MIFNYIDPGTGSMLISATIALISVGFFMLKGLVYRKLNIGGDKGEMIDPNTEYGLVFFSEGKQYWNVFFPLLDECERRGIKAQFFTSDKNDPALNAQYENVDIKYIGSGREAYFILNRLRADMVVMTTPGLDVLEIKRSPYVKHYSHITHATGCFAGYKSYAVDYFDSILIGGNGDIPVVRELENLRNIHNKDIEVVGLTYLDVLRDKLSKENYDYRFFSEKRKTILISPTWSNHGLLTKYGDKILTALENASDYNVIIRPHPQSFISEVEMIEGLMERFPANDQRIWNRDVENLEALSHADIMISDFSGIIFDFYTLFGKPILTMNSHYEKRGRDAIDIAEDPWDIQMLDRIGRKIYDEDVDNLINIIDETLSNQKDTTDERKELMEMMDMYPNEAKFKSMDYIERTMIELVKDKEVIVNESSLEYEEVTGLKGLFKPSFLLQAFISSVLLSGLIFWASNNLYEGGLNQIFFERLLPYSIIANTVMLMVLVLSSWLIKDKNLLMIGKKEKFSISNILLVLFPLTPIIQYVMANQDTLNFKSSSIVFLVFAIASILLVVVVPWLLSTILKSSLTSSISISFLFILFNMASFGRSTRMLVITLVMVAIIIICFISMYFDKKKILIVISLIFFVTNLVVSVTNVDINNGVTNVDINNESKLMLATKELTIKKTPDVYILIYDSYANEETMIQYGYDNSDQYNYLLDEGFAIYDGTYSVAATSLASMSHVFNPDVLEANNRVYRQNIAEAGSSLNLFRNNDYLLELVQESEYMTQDYKPIHDFYYPGDANTISPHKIIINAVMEGEFRFDVDFTTITYEDYLDAKLMYLST